MNIYIVVFAFIVLDFITGLVKAICTNTFSSGKMREGLWHKASLVLLIILALLVEYAQGFMELGITIPVVGGASVYIPLMELGSILENLCKINPERMPDKLHRLFGGVATEDSAYEDQR